MDIINFKRSYTVRDDYEHIKKRASEILHKYLAYPGLIEFDYNERKVIFTSERLIPSLFSNRPRIMLLFSNPHPHSIQQGMFLSPNTKGRKNLFWTIMEESDWLSVKINDPSPEELADICLKTDYEGPFDLIFYCYYAFPTDMPEDIVRIFGKEYFNRFIQTGAIDEFRKTVQDTAIEAVVTFNKGIFNLVSKSRIDKYTDRLTGGEVIQSSLKLFDRYIPVFLTYPTGWRYHREFLQLHKNSLERIKKKIISC